MTYLPIQNITVMTYLYCVRTRREIEPLSSNTYTGISGSVKGCYRSLLLTLQTSKSTVENCPWCLTARYLYCIVHEEKLWG